ncbi:MAG: hypothetical protein V8S86_14055 [Eubacteriales bacterium]
MTMTILWTGMVVLSILCGLATGQSAQVAAAAVEGTQAAVELCLSIAGMLCLWTGVMEVMRRSGLAEKLSRLLRPMLRLLFPQVARDRETMDSIAANVSANLLGAGQRCHPSGAGGRPADEPLQPRGGFRCAVHAGGVQYGLHPTDPHHGGHGAGWGRERRSL